MVATDKSSENVTFATVQARVRDGSVTALSAVQQATSGASGALKVVSDNGDAAAAQIRGAGTVLDLQSSAGTSLFSVAQSGAITSTGAQTVTGNFTITGQLTVNSGNVSIATAGNGLKVAEGANAKMGTATLVAGAATVSTTAVTANSRIFLTSNTDGGAPGFVRVSARTAGTSFTITSSSGTDTSTIAWMMVEPA